MASRNVCDMDETNKRDVLLELFDQIPVSTLLMVEIVEDAETGAGDRLHNGESFGDAVEIDGGVLEAIDGLDDALETCSAKEFGCALEGLDGRGVLSWILVCASRVRGRGGYSLS
jgi:hypothetical protein